MKTASDHRVSSARQIPLTVKILYLAFLAVLIPFYSLGHGLTNFLWFSNVALLTTAIAVVFEIRVLASMQLIGVGILELLWSVDFILGLLVGESFISLAGYMFDEAIPLVLRVLSLYHLLLPWILIWLVWRLEFDNRGWWAQTLLAWMILLLCYFFTEPDDNINWAFGFRREPQAAVPAWLYLLFVMAAYPLVVFVPSHFIFKWMMTRVLPSPKSRDESASSRSDA